MPGILRFDDHGVGVDAGDLAVDEDQRAVLLHDELCGAAALVIDDRGPDDAVDLTFQQRGDVVELLDGVVETAREEDAVAVREERRLDLLEDAGEEGVAEVRDHDADRHGVFLLAQLVGKAVRHVAELLRETCDAGAEFAAHADSAAERA